MKATSRRNWIIAGIAAALLAAGGVTAWKRGRMTTVEYRVVEVRRGDLDVSILATGVVQPENRLEIKPPIAGRAEQVLVDEGYLVRKGQVLVWMSSTERAAMLDAARARGPEELKSWEDYYKATPVLAPIDGMVIQRNIQPGQTFATNDAILVMSDRLTVQAQVDETDIAQIKLHEKAKITLDAYPDQPIQGEVDKIAYDAKTVNNVTTYIVDVLPERTPRFMRSGMTANVSFLVDSRKGILLAPSEAIKRKADTKAEYVLVRKGPGDEEKEREIETGLSDGKRTEIVTGLAEGESLLVPQLKLGGPKTAGGSPFSPMGHGTGGKPH